MNCAYDPCKQTLLCRIHTPTGWANLCREHYDLHFQMQADKANDAIGLTTVDQMRAYCVQKLNGNRAPGIWWKGEVKAQAALGKRVSVAAMELSLAGRQEE